MAWSRARRPAPLALSKVPSTSNETSFTTVGPPPSRGRRRRPKALDDLRKLRQDQIHVVGGRPAPEREGERALRLPLGEAHGAQDVGWLAGRRAAPARDRGDPGEIERVDQVLSL